MLWVMGRGVCVGLAEARYCVFLGICGFDLGLVTTCAGALERESRGPG